MHLGLTYFWIVCTWCGLVILVFVLNHWVWLRSSFSLLLLTGFVSITLFSALEQIHRSPVACDSEWVAVAFCGTFWYPLKWHTYSAVWLLHGWCHVKLLPLKCCTYSAVWLLRGWCHVKLLPLKWHTYSAIWLLRGWCHVKLPPLWWTFCLYTMQPCTSLQCHFI